MTGCPEQAIAENWPLVLTALSTVGQGSAPSLAGAIATISVETASTFAPCREAFWLSEEWRKNNLRYYPYYGRGYIQLTWDYNYRTYGQLLGLDQLEQEPDLALDPNNAARIFAAYWQSHDLATVADARDWRELRRRVQGGDAGLDRLIRITEDLLAL